MSTDKNKLEAQKEKFGQKKVNKISSNLPVIGRLVTVCDKCLQASCWQGIMMCDGARNAGTVDKTIEELKQLALEHPSYWEENVR